MNFEFYSETNFKQTELGPLPQDWQVVSLGEIAETIKGRKPKSLEENCKLSYLPYLTAEYLRTKIAKQFCASNEDNIILIKEDDLIFIWDGSNAGDVFTGLEGVLASTMVTIEPINKNLQKKFLYYFLKTKFSIFNSQTTGSTIPHVNKSTFLNLPIPLPPLSEQQAIAEVLQTVQQAKEKTEDVIKATRELKKSMMKYLFTYGPYGIQTTETAENQGEIPSVPPAVPKTKLKDTEIGPLPEHWKVVKLEDVVMVIKGRKPLSLSEKKGMDYLPYLTAEYFRKNKPKQFSAAKGQNIVKVNEDDLVFIWDGSNAGEIFTGLNGILASTMIKIQTISEHIQKKFLFYFLKTKFKIFNSQTTGSTIPHVNKTLFLNLPIPLPPLSEQKAIADILQTIDEKIEKEEARKQALEKLFKSMLHNLMSGKLRVKSI